VRWRDHVDDLPDDPADDDQDQPPGDSRDNDEAAAAASDSGVRSGGGDHPPGSADAGGLDSPRAPSYGEVIEQAIRDRTGGVLPLSDHDPATPAAWATTPTGDACGVCGRLEVVRETACRTRCMACGTIDGGCG
jgi:hypothetical protein